LTRDNYEISNFVPVSQFNSALKKIMIGAVHHGIKENCLALDDSALILPSTTMASLSYFEKSLNMNDDEAQNQWLHSTTDLFLNSLQNNLSEFKLNVLNHVAGYI
jgi:hypothetical protein